MSSLAPIVFFAYSRPDHTLRTLEALKRNTLASQSDIIIYSDAAKNSNAQGRVQEVRNYLRSVTGFKSVRIIEREKNWGLAQSIIDGVSSVLNEYGKAIILEDDLVTNPFFLEFMNEGLLKYENTSEVACIHGFVYPIQKLPETFFIRGADCWGWATWTRAWNIFNPDGSALLAELEARKLTHEFDFYGQYPYTQMLKDQISGKNSSWAIRWLASAFLLNMLTLYPGKSLAKNIGFDEGTHDQGGDDSAHFGILNPDRVKLTDIPIKNDKESYQKFSDFFRSQKRSFFRRAIAKAKSILKKRGVILWIT